MADLEEEQDKEVTVMQEVMEVRMGNLDQIQAMLGKVARVLVRQTLKWP